MVVQLKNILQSAGLEINRNQIALFQKYVDLIVAWNKRTNLVSRKDEARLVERHILESISVLTAIKIEQGASIIDIGSGAGFPSLPVGLLRPDLHFLLVESKRLKSLFLREAISRLGLNRVAVVCDRAENLASDAANLSQFDLVFVRAVASMDVVFGWCEKLLTSEGALIFWKGGDVSEEVSSLISKSPHVTIDITKMNERFVNPERDKKLVLIRTMKS